jgi:hypothetical protein
LVLILGDAAQCEATATFNLLSRSGFTLGDYTSATGVGRGVCAPAFERQNDRVGTPVARSRAGGRGGAGAPRGKCSIRRPPPKQKSAPSRRRGPLSCLTDWLRASRTSSTRSGRATTDSGCGAAGRASGARGTATGVTTPATVTTCGGRTGRAVDQRGATGATDRTGRTGADTGTTGTTAATGREASGRAGRRG